MRENNSINEQVEEELGLKTFKLKKTFERHLENAVPVECLRHILLTGRRSGKGGDQNSDLEDGILI